MWKLKQIVLRPKKKKIQKDSQKEQQENMDSLPTRIGSRGDNYDTIQLTASVPVRQTRRVSNVFEKDMTPMFAEVKGLLQEEVEEEERLVFGKPYHHEFYNFFAQDGSVYTPMHVNENSYGGREVLLMISKAIVMGHPVTVLYDSGSNTSFITHAKASQLGLKGVDRNLFITKTGNTIEYLTTKQYAVPLTDEVGHEWIVDVYGMKEITTEAKTVNIADLKRVFGLPSDFPLFRPHGKVDMLIGADCCCIIPQVIATKSNLQLMRNQFGFCVRGYHPALRIELLSNNF